MSIGIRVKDKGVQEYYALFFLSISENKEGGKIYTINKIILEEEGVVNKITINFKSLSRWKT